SCSTSRSACVATAAKGETSLMRLYDPTSSAPQRALSRAAPIASLEGMTMGVLENGKLNAIVDPGFRENLYRAREMRGDLTFGEQILDIADDGRNDWVKAKNGRLVPNKELVLRSKLRIEARQFHMARLHPQTWGDRQQIDVKNDWALLTEEERRRKAEEIV